MVESIAYYVSHADNASYAGKLKRPGAERSTWAVRGRVFQLVGALTARRPRARISVHIFRGSNLMSYPALESELMALGASSSALTGN